MINPLPNSQILDLSKFKEFANNTILIVQMVRFVF